MHAMFARITKVDEVTRSVTGRAAQEVIDRDNEVFDYASSKPEFMKWSAEVSADTDGKSLGNIRSMHGNVAAGKVTNIDFNDVEKAIDITAKIIDDNEWEKVLEGVHTGFSIGGRYSKKWAEPMGGKMVTRYTAVPAEISIVDRPCCPTAKFFTIHKRDGSVVKREFAWTHELTLIDGKLSLVEKRDFSQKERDAAADSGAAMPDGSFPIKSKSDLANAIRLAGNAKDPAKAKAHIKARAKALGASDAIPDTWKLADIDFAKFDDGTEVEIDADGFIVEKGGPGSGRHKSGITNAEGIAQNGEASRLRMEQSQRMQDDATRNAGDKHGDEGVTVADAAANATHVAEATNTAQAHQNAAVAHRAAADFHYNVKGVGSVQGMWRPEQHELIARSHARQASMLGGANPIGGKSKKFEEADDLEKGGPGSGRKKSGIEEKADADGKMASQITSAALKRTQEAEKNPSADSHALAAGQHAAAAIYQRKAAESAKPLNAGFENAHLGAAAMHDRMAQQHARDSVAYAKGHNPKTDSGSQSGSEG